MSMIKKYASAHPIGFSVVVTLLFLLFTVLSGVFSFPVTDESRKLVVSGSIRLAGTLFFMWVLWRFGWIKEAGITDPGSKRVWFVVAPAIFYTLLIYTFAFFNQFAFTLNDLEFSLYVFSDSFAGGVFQEIVFRGVILYALVRGWRNEESRLLRGVLVSALIFGAVHFFNILNVLVAAFSPLSYGTPIIATIMQVINTCISGLVYAAIVLYGKSVWPAAVYHGLLNATINVLWLTMPDTAETLQAWFLITLMKIPLIIYGYVLMRGVKKQTFTLTPQAV